MIQGAFNHSVGRRALLGSTSHLALEKGQVAPRTALLAAMRVAHPRPNDVQPPPVQNAEMAQPDEDKTTSDASNQYDDKHVGAVEQVERATDEILAKARHEIREIKARQGPCPKPFEPGDPSTPAVVPAAKTAEVVPPCEPPSPTEPTEKPKAESAASVPKPPDVAAPSANMPRTQGIPFMLTAALKAELSRLGYSPDAFLHMTPRQAREIVFGAVPSPTSVSAVEPENETNEADEVKEAKVADNPEVPPDTERVERAQPSAPTPRFDRAPYKLEPPRETSGKQRQPGGRTGARPIPPPPRKSSVIVCAADVVMRPKQWLWKGHLLRGAQELFTGIPGIGKSQAHCDLVARVTTGEPWPDGTRGGQPANVIMITAEDCLDQEVVPRLVAAGADLQRVSFLKAIKKDGGGERMFLLGEDLDQLESDIVRIGDVGLVTIDPITAYMGKADSHSTTEVRGQLAPLRDLAERTNIAFSTITHPPKAASQRAIDHFIGSQAFIAAGRIGHVAIEEVEDGEKTGRILFANPKNNPHTKMPTLAYTIEQCLVYKGDNPSGDIVGSRIVWDADPVNLSADQAVAAASDAGGKNEPTAKGDAVDFLRTVLADGPVAVPDLEREARAAGYLKPDQSISQSKPFRSAREVLGIKPVKDGMAGGWVWDLPKMPSGAEDAPQNERAPSGGEGTFGEVVDLSKHRLATAKNPPAIGPAGDSLDDLDPEWRS